jgi:TolA-binding protein
VTAAKPSCPRRFEAEALRDQRLNGHERARFEAHASSCATCAEELRALEDLGSALRASPGENDGDELHARRERTRLLAAFDASLVPAPKRRARWLAVGLAVAAALAAALVFWSKPRLAPVAQRRPAESIVVQADTSAQWSRQSEAERELITLRSGALSIHVDHTSSRRHLKLLLPDGELEDIGTTFTVSAEAGHTTRVAVQEGSVVLRLRGQPVLALGAGEAWSPPPPLAPTASVAAPTSAPSTRVSAADTAAAEFRGALAAMTRGNAALAAELFSTFLVQHPRDAHAEDAAYLRVLARQRTGNAAATEQAASDYLARYPHGFRRAEVQRLAGTAPGGTPRTGTPPH